MFSGQEGILLIKMEDGDSTRKDILIVVNGGHREQLSPIVQSQAKHCRYASCLIWNVCGGFGCSLHSAQ